MRIQCDACEGAAATVVCCADEAALCARCDVEIHAANKLASKHQRLPLDGALPAALPRCDVCQEKAAFIFCVEDRALFCRDCDESIHVPGTLSGNHQRYLATGIRVGFSSVCSTHADQLPPNGSSKPATVGAGAGGATKTPVPAAQEVPSSPFLPPSGWAVEDLLQLSDYESSDKKESPLGFKELEWFADIDLFHGHAPAKTTAAEVPELFASPQPASNAAFYKMTSARQSKKPRLEVPDDEDYFIVPDLG
ncbi:B-box zinc finger protein 24-like [Phragmites australis]|uniref:B-box zinc finger protein 24-like n=1 Tax=Phragmites australis TaxID=29695 RepID=UPI002D765777|nr:B-box zinc finger protein 24-like [Phragmites australis]